jgi:hypothetical protein
MTGAAIAPLHERWFVDNTRYPVQFDAIFTATTWIPVGIAAGITLLAALAWHRRRGRAIVPGPLELGMSWENYTRLLSWMPLVIGLHAAVVLLVSGVSLRLFFPNLMLPSNFLGAVLGLTEIAIGLSFLYGALTRLGTIALALAWLAGAIVFGPLQLLEHAELLGIAFFLFATGRGPLALDMAMERLHQPIASLVPYSVPVLRVLIGLSIAIVAFTEKLWNVPMGLAFLADHPFNFFPALGVTSIGNREFLLIAGTVELTLGLLLISGAFTRLLILIIWVPFNLTLPLLGWRELVGHLPTYGIMALLLVWGKERTRPETALVRGVAERAEETGRARRAPT